MYTNYTVLKDSGLDNGKLCSDLIRPRGTIAWPVPL
jgi:hypothetical protein